MPCYQPHEVCITALKDWCCRESSDSTDGKAQFNWKPCNCGTANSPEHGNLGVGDYFDDSEDPRRLTFDATLNYNRLPNGSFTDKRTQNLYRNLQIANQMHSCCFTCFKYCLGARKCRFGFPKDYGTLEEYFVEDSNIPTTSPYGLVRVDGRGRKRIIANPKSNNAHLNNHAFSPLLFIAHRANMDCKYMDVKCGTAEYVSSYSSKMEAPDFSKIGNIYVKKIAGLIRNGRDITDLQKLNAVGSALIDSEIVGAPQMCFVLTGLPLVVCSRPVESINPLHASLIHSKIKSAEERLFSNENDPAINSGNSHLSKRNAYSELLKFHLVKFNTPCIVTYYSLRSDYTSKPNSNKNVRKMSRAVPMLQHPLAIDESTGFILDAVKSFSTGGYIFTKRRKRAVIHLSPHVPANNEDDRSAYSILLLHRVWPDGEQLKITKDGKLEGVKEYLLSILHNGFQPHVAGLLKIISTSEDHHTQSLSTNSVVNSVQQICESEIGMNTDADDPSNHDTVDESTGVIYTEPNDMDINDSELVGIQGYSDLLNFDQANIITESEQVMATQHIENAKITYEQNQKDNFNETELSALPVVSVSLREDSTLPFVQVKNYTTRLASLDRVIENFDDEQRHAYNTVKKALDGTNHSNRTQLIMFASGEGGTGKSHFIKAISEYANLKFGKTRGKYGRVIRWGPTGSSAYNIGGCTWQSGLKKAKRTKKGAEQSNKR
jgi:hypothetical protein